MPYPSSTKWRIRILSNVSHTGGDNLQVVEVQMRTSVGGSDACTGGTASADSEFSGSFPASYAFDDSTTTRWLPASGTGASEHWLQYEFSSSVSIVEYTIQAITSSLNFPNAAPRDFFLEYWDGTYWRDTDFRKDQTSWGTTEVRVFTVTTDGTYRANQSSPSVSAPGAVKVSSESSTNVAANAFDYAEASVWETASGSTATIEYDFYDSIPLTGYRIQGHNVTVGKSPKTWTLEYWDGSAWQTKDTQTNVAAWTTYEWREYTFSNTTSASKWRLNITANQGNSLLGATTLMFLSETNTAGYPPTAAMTQFTLEALTGYSPAAVLSQEVVEALVTTTDTAATLTQLVVEVLCESHPPLVIYTGSGGVQTGGAATTALFSGNIWDYTPSGGITTGGAATTLKCHEFLYTASGGITTGGSAGLIVVKDYPVSGGITTGGTGSPIWIPIPVAHLTQLVVEVLVSSTELKGSTDITITGQADLVKGTPLASSSTISITAQGDLKTGIALAATSSVSLTAQGELAGTPGLSAAATITTSATGSLEKGVELGGSATVSVSTRASLIVYPEKPAGFFLLF